MFNRNREDPNIAAWARARDSMKGVDWFSYHGGSGGVSPPKAGYLITYYNDLASGRWGTVHKMWFDAPQNGDIPWEPCAVVETGGRFAVVSEDFAANPRCLREYSTHASFDEACAAVKRLRPWGYE